jgi:sporulation protein YlmC with PRC-barrel domain
VTGLRGAATALRLHSTAARQVIRLPRERGHMAQRATELIGKGVVSADTGERLGTVSDILLDESDHRLVGLVVRRGGLMKSEHVLPSAAVQTYGRDTVVSRTGHDLVAAKDWQRLQTPTPPDVDPGL